MVPMQVAMVPKENTYLPLTKTALATIVGISSKHNEQRRASMYNRRMRSGVTVADFSGEYIRMLPPWAVVKPWYMLGDHGPYSPVIFR